MTQSSGDEAILYVHLGASRYRIERPFDRLPADAVRGMVTAVAVDSKDRVYVYQRFDMPVHRGPAPAVHMLSPEGEYLGAWGNRLVKDGHHIYIDPRDRVFLVDRDSHVILVTDTEGNELFSLGERDRPGRPFNHPASIVVAPSGDMYVADGYGGTEVHRFAPDGRHVATWGGMGSGPGQFTTPHGIWVLSDGRVFVGDREANRVQIFTPEGKYLAELTGFYHSMAVFGDADDNIYVSDESPRLFRFDKNGKRTGLCRPVLYGAHGVFGDSKRNLYLAETTPSRVTRLRYLDETA
jgi:peptidylglycine monooxygenase